MRTRSTHGLWSDAGYPRFRRDPFARDVALDPGGSTMPRITASHMLRSTVKTVSAPAISSFRGSIPHPTHPLCTLRVRRHRRLTQRPLASSRLEFSARDPDGISDRPLSEMQAGKRFRALRLRSLLAGRSCPELFRDCRQVRCVVRRLTDLLRFSLVV